MNRGLIGKTSLFYRLDEALVVFVRFHIGTIKIHHLCGSSKTVSLGWALEEFNLSFLLYMRSLQKGCIRTDGTYVCEREGPQNCKWCFGILLFVLVTGMTYQANCYASLTNYCMK